MKTSKKVIVSAIYVVVLITYVIGMQKFYGNLGTNYFFNPIALLGIELAGAFIFGMLLGLPHLLKLKFNKEGRYCYNLSQALIIGIPTFLLGISFLIYYGTDISIPLTRYLNTDIEKFFIIASGLIAISSIDKKVKNT